MKSKEYGVNVPIVFRRVKQEDIDKLSLFDCGNRSINNFIKNECLNTNESVTYLFVNEDNQEIIGFCSLCCTGILLKDDGIQVNTYSHYPSIEIDYFAVAEKYRSIPYEETSTRYETLSNVLFQQVIKYIESISRKYVGATHVCLYSVPRAFNFYKRNGFLEFEPYMQRDKKTYIKNCIPMFLVIN